LLAHKRYNELKVLGSVNGFPTFNRRAIEHFAIFKHIFIDKANWDRNTVFFTFDVGETK